jgi:DNA polymerase-3 subunit beta
VFAKFGNQLLTSNLIDGQFPNYRRVIPESQEQQLVVEKDLLESAIRRVSLLVEQKSRRIFLILQEDNLVITSEESEIGMAREEVPCQYQGPEETIALNYRFLTEPLREMVEDNVSIEFTDTSKAVTMTASPKKDYLHIVMPMQTK